MYLQGPLENVLKCALRSSVWVDFSLVSSRHRGERDGGKGIRKHLT